MQLTSSMFHSLRSALRITNNPNTMKTFASSSMYLNMITTSPFIYIIHTRTDTTLHSYM